MKYWTPIRLAFMATYVICFVISIYDLYIWRP